MSNVFWLTEAQMARLRPYFPKSQGRPRVDGRLVLSGTIFINRNGLRWCDAQASMARRRLYDRRKRWSDMGVHGPAFRRAIEACFAPSGTAPELVMALDEAIDTLLSLQSEDCHPLPVDAGRRLQADAELRWHAAGLHDLACAARRT